MNLNDNLNTDSNRHIEFEGEQKSVHYYRPASDVPKVVEWTINNSGGYIKTAKQASYVLVTVAISAIIISLFVMFSDGVEVSPKALENPEYGLPEPS